MNRLLIAVLIALTACADDSGARLPLDSIAAEEQFAAARTAAIGRRELSPAGRAAIELGNTAFRAKQYEEALRRYREAAADAPGNAAPLFGMQMAARALGNRALADSAAQRLKEIAPATPGDPHALPPNHPQVKVSEDVGRKAGR